MQQTFTKERPVAFGGFGGKNSFSANLLVVLWLEAVKDVVWELVGVVLNPA